uniref:Uncharacterized protein n=1 Tax=Caenorhabditis japonica TaxID=281687 RepID=A0A8R1E9I5_CAEJA
MSVRQAEKDVELEVGHVEEKNVVVEVEDSVTGGESEERLGAERKQYMPYFLLFHFETHSIFIFFPRTSQS